MTLKVKVNGEDREFSVSDLAGLARRYGIDQVANGRISWLFMLQLHLESECNGIDPAMVIDELRGLEGGPVRTATKAATQYAREPLKGLWHKHFFSATFLVRNIKNQLGGGKLESVVADAFGPLGSVITAAKISDIAKRVAVDTFQAREAEGRLTGEWIIFAKHDGGNYYLALTTHDAGDEVIYQQITSICVPQFPFLKSQVCR